MPQELVYDLGLHRGEDTEFYLAKGFRVVAVDANPELCEAASEKFAGAVQSGQLTIVNRAVAEQPGTITFYRNPEYSEWGTVDPEWVKRNLRRTGVDATPCSVTAVPLSDLIAEFGPAYFIKIDIEGMDLVALKSVRSAPVPPKYISIESEKVSFAKLREEFDVFAELGFDRFKIVPQHLVPAQRAPKPPREGEYVDWAFTHGQSGLFGEEAPGRWMSADEAIDAYKRIFLRYLLIGDDPLIRNPLLKRVVGKVLGHVGWFDTHAKRA